MTEAWRAQAACRLLDRKVFFPPGERSNELVAARRVCAGCPVSLECLAFAVATRPPFGIWCGFTSEEIRRLSEHHPDARRLKLGPDPDLVDLVSRLPLEGEGGFGPESA